MLERTGAAVLTGLLRPRNGEDRGLPARARLLGGLAAWARRYWLALGCVVLPGLLATLYFALVASDVYISESRFVVREPDKPAATGLGLILKGIGFSNSGDELMATREYILSRDALAALDRDGAF